MSTENEAGAATAQSAGEAIVKVAPIANVYAVTEAFKAAFAKWLEAPGDVLPRITVPNERSLDMKDRTGAHRTYVAEAGEDAPAAQCAQHAANLRRANNIDGKVFSHVRYVTSNEDGNKFVHVPDAVWTGIAKGKGSKTNTVTGTLVAVAPVAKTLEEQLAEAQSDLLVRQAAVADCERMIVDLTKAIKDAARKAKLEAITKAKLEEKLVALRAEAEAEAEAALAEAEAEELSN